ncbi:hypothetical protein V5F29_05040 [Xanthobacter aminoxidans]|uniref:hypothetical protein n=1 Tax=Xanthobacter aminoxidans TaxID=186280 RepID=UPI00372CAF16
MSEPFEPVIGRPFYVSTWSNEAGSGMPALVHLYRSFDRGQKWLIACEEPAPLVELGMSMRFTSYEQGIIYAVKLVTISSISSLFYRLSQ